MTQDRNVPALTARSVLASLLLGMRSGRLAGGALVRAAAQLGVAEGTVRVALSRMVAAGELNTRDGEYELAGPLLARHGRQEEGRRPRLRRWDGTWRMAVVGSPAAGRAARPAAERGRLRQRLAELRLAEWREGVWVRPDNLAGAPAAVDGVTWVVGARFAEGDDAAALAARLWDTHRWARAAASLRAAMADAPPERDLPASFAVAAAVVRHVRDDPLLPDALLPSGWPGDAIRAEYDDYEARFRASLRALLG